MNTLSVNTFETSIEFQSFYNYVLELGLERNLELDKICYEFVKLTSKKPLFFNEKRIRAFANILKNDREDAKLILRYMNHEERNAEKREKGIKLLVNVEISCSDSESLEGSQLLKNALGWRI